MNTMLAAGDVDADMIFVPGDPVKFIESGLFTPLDDLIPKYPNIKAAFEYRPEIQALCVYDGKQYTLPHRFCVSTKGRTSPPEWVVTTLSRQDVIDEYGIKNPTTIDEMYDYMKMWKQDNPDMYPWIIRGGIGGGGGFGVMAFAGSYGLYLGNGDSNDWYPENGKMVYQWIKPEMETYINVLRQWYSEGLINPAYTVGADGGKAMADIQNGYAILTQGYPTEIAAYGWYATADGGEWTPMGLPKGPKGDQLVLNTSGGVMGGYSAILATSKNADYVLAWLDHGVYSELGLIRLYYGLEGVTYEMVNGEPKLTDAWLAQDAWTTKLFDMGTQMESLPIPYSAEHTASYDFMTYDGNGIPHQWEPTIHLKDNALPGYYSPLATPAEAETVARYLTDLNTYRDETVAKWILGTEPVDFQKFVDTLKSMGLDELQKIEQDKYDRMKK